MDSAVCGLTGGTLHPRRADIQQSTNIVASVVEVLSIQIFQNIPLSAMLDLPAINSMLDNNPKVFRWFRNER